MELKRRLRHQYDCCKEELAEANRLGDTFHIRRLTKKIEGYEYYFKRND